jgi:hypothetical protein
MNILTIWQKQIERITKKDTRSIFLLSYKRLLQLLISYAYFLLPVIVLAMFLSGIKTLFSWYVFSFFTVFISQITALLLRPSMQKKDGKYLLRVLSNDYGYLILFSILSLIIPIFALPIFLTFVVFFQLIAVDGRIRLISVLRTIRATLLLLWYNLPAVVLSVSLLTGILWAMFLFLNSAPIWLHFFLFGSFYLVLMPFVALLALLYTASVYEHEHELF